MNNTIRSTVTLEIAYILLLARALLWVYDGLSEGWGGPRHHAALVLHTACGAPQRGEGCAPLHHGTTTASSPPKTLASQSGPPHPITTPQGGVGGPFGCCAAAPLRHGVAGFRFLQPCATLCHGLPTTQGYHDTPWHPYRTL